MAESGQQETASTQVLRPVARTLQWTAGQVAGLVFTSVFAGTGGLFLMAQAGFLSTSKQLTEITAGMSAMTAEIEQTKKQMAKLESHQNSLKIAIDEVKEVLKRSNGERQRAEESMKYWFEEQRSGLNSFEENISGRLESNRRSAATHASNTAEAINEVSKEQRRAEMKLSSRISALSSRIESVQNAFVDTLKGLVEEGELLIKNEDFAAIEEWVAKVNYMVRSLGIPTEAGLLRDTSVVKEDLRNAMNQFDKAQDDKARLVQAQRVLVIVKVVSELAVGGRIP